MGSPEKPIDVEMGDMDVQETEKLNPKVKLEDGAEKTDAESEDRFTGLKKEELLRESSKKKWVVARWVLFVIFWVGWVGMLVGAIIIVINAPRCKKEPSPVWYQDTVVYQADVRKYAGDLKGMKDHLNYVRYLKAKTLTVCHADNPDDPTKVVDDQQEAFTNLSIAADAGKDEEKIKVVVDLRIDAISINSPQFINSATKNCSGGAAGKDCQLFMWKATSPGTGWVLHPDRGESYRVAEDASNMALLNYEDQSAMDYLKMLVEGWVGYGADGLQLRGLDNIADPLTIVDFVRDSLNGTQIDVEKEKKKELGLFLLAPSSTVSEQVKLFGTDVNDTRAPVVINTQLSSPPDSGTGTWAKNIIEQWRNESKPFIGAFSVNTMQQQPLAMRLGTERAAGLSLLSFTLAGVPIMRCGDEALLDDDTFAWPGADEKRDISPINASASNIDILKDIADVRVSPFRTMQSIRWDDTNSVFVFRATNTTDVLAFARRWDTKARILVVSNLSTKDHYVQIKKMEDDKYDDKAKVLYSSNAKAKEFGWESTFMPAGLTLVVQV